METVEILAIVYFLIFWGIIFLALVMGGIMSAIIAYFVLKVLGFIVGILLAVIAGLAGLYAHYA